MSNELYAALRDVLDDKPSAEIPIKELERIAGDDWLLEVNAQAQQLEAALNQGRCTEYRQRQARRFSDSIMRHSGNDE